MRLNLCFLALILTAIAMAQPADSVLTVVDTAAVADTVAPVDTVAVVDSVAMVDSVVSGTVVSDTVALDSSVADTVAVADSVAPVDTVAVADTVASVDSVVSDTAALDSSVADTVAVADSVASVDSVAATDTVAVDSLIKDSVVVDTVALDTVALDTAALDTAALDTAALDTTALDTLVVDTAVVDSSIKDSVVPEIVYTEIGGEINGFLTAAKSPYRVVRDLIVSDNSSLVIDAGTVLYFMPGTSLDIRGGAFAAIGKDYDAVRMTSADSTQKWDGVKITGEIRSNLNEVQIEKARVAVALENTGADLQNISISNSTVGISIIHSNALLQNISLSQNEAALMISNESFVEVSNSELSENQTALFVGTQSEVILTNVDVSKNQVGLVDMGFGIIKDRNLKIEQNETGVVGAEIPAENIRLVAKNNTVDIAEGGLAASLRLPEVAKNAYADRYKAAKAENIVLEEKKKDWKLSGNVETEIGYHKVDTYKSSDGRYYDNYFRVPGLYSNYNTFLKLQSPNDQILEFSADIGSDQWYNWNVHKINLTYMDHHQKASLGDVFLDGGELYLNGTNMFGGAYSVGVQGEDGGKPAYEAQVFAGETNRPKLLGKRNPDIYKDYIDDGEAEAQEMIAGTKLTWNMHKRFNGSLGYIGSKDYIKDPYLRDGMSSRVNTVDPQITSRTFFAEGNWLFWPGDIELNGQVAMGAADTSDAQMQRAVNQIFNQAGVSVENFGLIRKLMKNETLVSRLSRSELEEIFGDNSGLSLEEMRSQLRTLISRAQAIRQSYEEREDDQSEFMEWDGNNLAAMASLRWGIGNTVVKGHFKYVGAKYYSAGSPDQLSNSREWNFSVDQRIFKFWKLGLSYNLNVENASIDGKNNFFGLSEGSNLGLFLGQGDHWDDDHVREEIRTLFVHDINFKNSFDLGMFKVMAQYKLNYRNRNRATRLYADYTAESGVFKDSWFAPRDGRRTYTLRGDGDSVEVDSARFAKYYALANQEYIADGFQEKLLKHTFELDASLKYDCFTFRAGGVWSYRSDMSEFKNDDMLKEFDFEDETYGYLGYFFHGTDYFEQRYPLSWQVDLPGLRNMLTFTPRLKYYTHGSRRELELNAGETFEKTLIPNFLEVSLNGEMRFEFAHRAKRDNESEGDLSGFTTVTVHYTKDLYSDYTLGAYMNYRPDARADQYRDLFASFSLNYAF